jgi:Ca-activated chloride channel family protein
MTTRFAIVALLLSCALRSHAGREPPPDRGIIVSNFGHMETREAEVLPLRHTDVQAEIIGVVSSVRVSQRFVNPSPTPIEAVYVFPLPERAAIYAMTMRIGDRVIAAQIRPRDEAQRIYRQAQSAGKTASLLEQERPNIFTQSVANVMPGAEIDVELAYVEELVPQNGEYQFVFPMVVGPRYLGDSEDRGKSGDGWASDGARVGDASRITPRMMPKGMRPGHDISLALEIDAGITLVEPHSATHQFLLERHSPSAARIALAPGDAIPNRDFVVRYRLGTARPQAALLTNHDARGGHFLLTLQPKLGMTDADAAPKEYVFVVDTSGSMAGAPLAKARAAMRRCLLAMRPNDRFQIIRFDSNAEAMAPHPVAPTRSQIEAGLAWVDAFDSRGGTEFLPAMELALNARRDPERARIIIFMTDGYIGHEWEVLRYLREHLQGANLFAVGIGSSVNRYLIDGMARLGHGAPFVMLERDAAEPVIDRLFATVARPALTNIQIDWGDLAVSDVTPAALPDLFAERPLVVTGRFARAGSGIVVVRGCLAGRPYEERLQVSLPDAANSDGNPTVGLLWARRALEDLADRYDFEETERARLKDETMHLALRYGLMSAFTSFVAVDSATVNRKGSSRRASVPVALPSGVEESAAPPVAFASASLSHDTFVPGDPDVRITAPDDTTAVTLIFPSGEVKACRRDPRTGEWVASFLVPEGTPDGIYRIQVIMTARAGAQRLGQVRYQIDSAAPLVRARLEPADARPGETLRLVVESAPPVMAVTAAEADLGDPGFAARVSEELAVVDALLPSGERTQLVRGADGRFVATLTAPAQAGRYSIAIVARDAAGNKTPLTAAFTVR